VVRNRKPRVKFEVLVISLRRSRQCGAVNPASFNKSRGGGDVCDDDKVIGSIIA